MKKRRHLLVEQPTLFSDHPPDNKTDACRVITRSDICAAEINNFDVEASQVGDDALSNSPIESLPGRSDNLEKVHVSDELPDVENSFRVREDVEFEAPKTRPRRFAGVNEDITSHAESVPHKRHHKPSKPGDKPRRGRPPKPSEAILKERFTVHLPVELIERARNLVFWNKEMTLAQLATDAFARELAKHERRRGGAYPQRIYDLVGGRPRKC